MLILTTTTRLVKITPSTMSSSAATGISMCYSSHSVLVAENKLLSYMDSGHFSLDHGESLPVGKTGHAYEGK